MTLELIPRAATRSSRRSSASRRSATAGRSRCCAPTCARGAWATRRGAGDGVVAGAGRVDGRPVFCYAQDPSFPRRLAGRAARRLDRAGAAARRPRRRARRRLHRVRRRAHAGGPRGAGRLRADLPRARRAQRQVPQISVICGASAGGGSYSPALTDFVVMTERANMFLTGPAVVREVMGEDVDASELGGPKVHERNGVAHFVATTDADAALLVRDLLDHLPATSGERPPQWRPVGPRRLRRPASPSRRTSARSTTCATSSRGIVDGGRLLEWAPRWARNIICGFARLDGRPGRRRRQPAALPGRRARRRVGHQGGALRAHLQRVRAAAGGARRHARASCPAPAGAARRDPPRRQARARVRRGDACRRSPSCCARRSAARSSP